MWQSCIMTGNELQRIRQANKRSQAEFGALVCVHRTTVSDWEVGASPVPELVDVIARMIDAKPEFLFELERVRGTRPPQAEHRDTPSKD